MRTSKVYFVGTPAEVGHHIGPVEKHLDVEIIDPADVLKVASAGDVAMFFSEHFDRFRQSVIELKQKNVATIYMIDGILEWRNAWENSTDEVACPYVMRPVLSHKVACIGENQARVLNGWGNAEKTEIIGVPRFDRYVEHASPQTMGKKAERFRLLVMTAKTPAFTDDQWATVRQSIADVKAYADQHSDSVEVIWRLTGGLDSEFGLEGSASDLTGSQLCDQLNQVDAVISTPSTAVVESMLAGKPTALLNYYDCPSYLNLAWTISHAKQLDSVVDQLKDPAPRKMHFQDQQLQQMLYRESSASERLIRLVRTMQEVAAEHVFKGIPLDFEPNLLPQPQLSPVTFNSQAMFPEAMEFAESNLNETQAQLAHARRHADHLNRRIEQLESELKQAHQIFDEIHQHPIAGPIVRIRERVLTTLQNVKRKTQTDNPS
ncbi:hypothetical protein OAG71_00845 [bacterium]|nr:hypothetical protein [bacterium]